MNVPPRFHRLVTVMFFVAVHALAFQRPARAPLPDFDTRAKTTVSAEQKAAAMELRARVRGAKVEFDDASRAAKSVGSTTDFLTGPGGEGKAVRAATIPRNDPHRTTKSFLDEHRKLFGHGSEELATTRVDREFTTPHSGLKSVVWQQHVDDIEVFEAVLVSHTTSKGELVKVSSLIVPNVSAAADRGNPQRHALAAAPNISAGRAIKIGAQNLGEDTATDEPAPLDDAQRSEKRQKFTARFLRGESQAKLIWFRTSSDTLRLCWDAIVTPRGRSETYRLLVDAETGAVLLRRCLTENLTDASFRVYTSDSPSPLSPGHATPITNQPPVVPRTLVTLAALDTNASPLGWINDTGNDTRGNNVDAHTDTDGNNIADLPRPTGSPLRVFDFPLNLAQAPSTYRSAAVVQLFYTCNWMHDRLYQLGFTEAAGNFQMTNFGRGGFGNDAVQADAQDGADINNADMTTFGDGVAPRLQMFLFTGPSPARDGDFDTEIVLHEYTHGLSNRRVGGGVGLSGLQSRGMGEGWSDWYALALLSESSDALDGNYAIAAYATRQFVLASYQQNYYFGIRRYPYSTDLTKNPLTFKDIDPGQASPHFGVPINGVFGGGAADEVHNQGEVWCVALWEARAALIAKHGFAIGNEMILRLVTDGMNLSPPNPNFLEARDAIIQADLVANGGTNRVELWTAFAKRGMGANATSPSSFSTAGVQESYDLPDDLTILPASGFISSGPVGGPFAPSGQTFFLTNNGSTPLNWTIVNTSAWLNVSSLGGTLAPGEVAASVNVTVAAAATSFSTGIYTATLRFTNLTSGFGTSRDFALRVAQPDHFTEQFSAADFDLQNTTITWTPDGSTSFYSACVAGATNFPSDPSGGTSLFLSDDDFATVSLGSSTVALYGRQTNTLHIGSNGYITFGSGDEEYGESVEGHFNRPRISALFRDLNFEEGGDLSWKSLSNRIAVTYFNVPEYGDVGSNSFQIEMFFDGRIRITWLGITARFGVTGLSAGDGTPTAFVETDLSALQSCAPPNPLADYDGDGMPDFWEVQFGFDTNNAADALLDFDGDGMRNLGEYLGGTNPTNALSVLKLSTISATNAALRFIAQPNLGYTVQFRTTATLAPWLSFTNIFSAPNTRTVDVNVPYPPPEPMRVYRVITPATP